MKIIKFLDKYFEEGFSVLLFAAMTIVIAIQIVLKWFGLPLAWTEETARYIFIWSIYIGASYAVKKQSHLKVELVTLFVKEKGQFVLDTISDIGFLIFAVVISYFGWQVVYDVAFVHVQLAPATKLNMGWAYASFAFGCTLIIIRLIQNLILRTKKIKTLKLENANEGGKK